MRQLLTAGGHRFAPGFRGLALEGVQTTIRYFGFQFCAAAMAIFSKASLNKWKKKKSRSVPCSSVPHPIQPSIAFQVPRNTTAGKLRSARRGPRSLVPRRLPTKQGRRPEGRKHNTPEARRRGTYEWHRHLQRDARAAVINAPRRRRRPPAARILRRRRRPWLHRRRRVPVLRFARRARARRRALLWQWPFFVPAQSAGAACTQCRCWRPPSAGLPPPNLRVAATTYSTRRRKASEPGSTYGTVRNPRRHRYTPLYIHRRRPPRRSRPPVEISDSVE